MYRYDISTHHFEELIFAVLIVILVLLGIGMVRYARKKGFKTYDGVRLKFKNLPGGMKILLCVPLAILAVFAALLVRLEIQGITFESRMNRGKGDIAQGEVHLLSSEESWYRDNFLGYTVSFEIDGTVYSPVNNFPSKVVEKFDQGALCRIVYGYLGSDLTVWSVDCVEEQNAFY